MSPFLSLFTYTYIIRYIVVFVDLQTDALWEGKAPKMWIFSSHDALVLSLLFPTIHQCGNHYIPYAPVIGGNVHLRTFLISSPDTFYAPILVQISKYRITNGSGFLCKKVSMSLAAVRPEQVIHLIIIGHAGCHSFHHLDRISILI